MSGIADQEEFWVRIKKEPIEGSKYEKYTYEVVEVRSVGEIAENCIGKENMKDLQYLREELCDKDETITMIQSVEIRIMQIQNINDVEKLPVQNKKCVVNGRCYAC